MKEVFADSHYFIALLNRRDQYHGAALAASQRQGMRVVSTHWVLVELADAMCNPSIRRDTDRFIRSFMVSPDVDVVMDLDPWFRMGLDLDGDRSDKAWSLTDCISFVVMEARGIREALTGDHDFVQAGFIPLLAVNP
jgi:predicted nucleic acid-binding protein